MTDPEAAVQRIEEAGDRLCMEYRRISGDAPSLSIIVAAIDLIGGTLFVFSPAERRDLRTLIEGRMNKMFDQCMPGIN